MEILSSLFQLFFYVVDIVTSNALYLLVFVLVAFLLALIFNFILYLLGGR